MATLPPAPNDRTQEVTAAAISIITVVSSLLIELAGLRRTGNLVMLPEYLAVANGAIVGYYLSRPSNGRNTP